MSEVPLLLSIESLRLNYSIIIASFTMAARYSRRMVQSVSYLVFGH